MSAHDLSIGKSDEWYTPSFVFEAMGEIFDLDVASTHTPIPAHHFAHRRMVAESLSRPWDGFVWMNPPFGSRNGIAPWLEKFFDHGNGVALTPDRTSAPWWIAAALRADAVLFVGKAAPRKGDPNKIQFIPGPGAKASSNGSGTCLLAAGERGVSALLRAERNGLGIVLIRASSVAA